ncbi:hypothetical protein [Tessaracoccus sp. G1721]
MTEAPTSYRIEGQSRAGGTAHVAVGTQQISLDTGWGSEPTGIPGRLNSSQAHSLRA